jgi:hypothetical protein
MGFMASVAKTTSGSCAIPSCCVVVLSGGRAVQKIIDVDPSSRCGGDKSAQRKYIKHVIEYWKDYPAGPDKARH